MQGDEGATSPEDGYRATVYCGSCGWQVPDPKAWMHSPVAQRQPCPSCGSLDEWIAELSVTDNVQAREFVGLKGKRLGRKKPVYELQDGDQLERSTGRWMKKRRIIDYDRDLYEETVVDAETGEVRHVCREPLSEHWGHGSAKRREIEGND